MLGEQVLRQGLWLRERIVAQEPHNGWNGRNRRLGMALFLVQSGPGNDSELISNFLLGKLQNKASSPDMLTQSMGLKIGFL
jgi:hypothetical protein